MKALTTALTSCSLLLMAPLSGMAQDDSKYGATEDEQTTCKEALNIYRDYMKTKEFDDAYRFWQTTCDVCPPKSSQKLWADGAYLIKLELKNNSSEERQPQLIDSLMAVYDTRAEHFPTTLKNPKNKCSVLERKGTDLYRFNKSAFAESYEILKSTIDCLEGKSSATAIKTFYNASALTMQRTLKGDSVAQNNLKIQMLNDYIRLTAYCDENITTATKEKTKQNYTKVKSALERLFVQIAKCDEIVPILSAAIESNPDDTLLKRQALQILENTPNCSDNELYLPIATELYKTQPSARAAYDIGIAYSKANQLDSSLVYMSEAVEKCIDCEDRFNYLIKAGKVASASNKTNIALKYARSAKTLQPKNGEVFMLMGDVIAASRNSCDDGALGSRSVYWVASDYYRRAKTLNPDLAELAGKKMNNMAKQFPTVDDIFTYGKQAGGTFTVPNKPGCPCSGETTTIRVR